MNNQVTQFSIKYRPSQLDRVRGHKKIVAELKRRSIKNDWPQVMLFSGGTGTGKDTLAFITAKIINCRNPKKTKGEDGTEYLETCEECPSCRSVINHSFNDDIQFVDCSSVGKEDVIKLKQQSQYTSTFGGSKKIFIIDEFQALLSPTTKQAFLAMIEKPNPNCIFIFTTMDISKVPDAIKKGRAQHYRLNPLSLPDLNEIVFDVLEKEKDTQLEEVFFDQEKGSLQSILIQSEGSARNLISMLERVLHGRYFLQSEMKEVFDTPSTIDVFEILKKLAGRKTTAIVDLQAYSSLEEFFYISYETLMETVAFSLNGVAVHDWKQGFYDILISSISAKDLENLLLLYNSIFENIRAYFKKGYVMSRFLLHITGGKSLKENTTGETKRRRVAI